MRVLSISTLFPSPARPAFGKFVANQMRAVAARGDVDLILVNPIGMAPWPFSRMAASQALRDTPATSELDGLTVHHPRFTTIPRIGGDSNPTRLARALLPLARKLHAAASIDVIDAQFFFPDGPAAATVARALGVPLSIKARGSDILYWSGRPQALRQIREAAAGASGMLAVSEALRADMIALGLPGERIAVHYTGLDHERFRPIPRAEARAIIAERLGLDVGSDPLLVSPGSLIPIKGQRLAIAALSGLPGAHLALAGAGPDEAALRHLVKGLGLATRVHFLGQVSHDILPALLSAANALVLPSEREGLANVWIEALACGTPLVIPDIGGAREVVKEPAAGRIAKRTPEAIARAVHELLADAPDRRLTAASADGFSWEVNAAALVRHWRALMRKN